MDTPPQNIKIVLLGDSGVGKSSLVLRFAMNEFRPYTEATIGASFLSKKYTLNERTVDFKIWDTAGQEKFHSLAPMYCRGAAAGILVFDICKLITFENLKKWVEELMMNGSEDIVTVICGNKCDLREYREVDASKAREYAEEVGAFYCESSARDNVNVEDIFRTIAEEVPIKEVGFLSGTHSGNRPFSLGTQSAQKGSFLSYC